MHDQPEDRFEELSQSVLSRAREMANDVEEFALEGIEPGDKALIEELRRRNADAMANQFAWLIGKAKTVAFHTSKIVDAEEDSGSETADRVNNALVFQASDIAHRLKQAREKAHEFLAVEKMWRV